MLQFGATVAETVRSLQPLHFDEARRRRLLNAGRGAEQRGLTFICIRHHGPWSRCRGICSAPPRGTRSSFALNPFCLFPNSSGSLDPLADNR